ncbi:hypothetical protein BJX61DRAFT_502334 [Aspergillus egyptiacus]|nr:hypothetical protein BJX61DRAFT_502334 [Aspergillus egyptiacus]
MAPALQHDEFRNSKAQRSSHRKRPRDDAEEADVPRYMQCQSRGVKCDRQHSNGLRP